MFTTIYTDNINYPTNYYRAYVSYQLTVAETTVTVDLKYGIALHSSYAPQSYDQANRQVACSIGTGHDDSDRTSYNIYNGSWKDDNIKLGPTNEGNSWWHQTGTASKVISRTSSAQTLYVLVWGRITGDSDTQKTNYATITIPALTSYTITYDVNGGSSASAPSNQTKYYGKTLTLSSTLPTRTGFLFTSWKATDNTLYNPGSSYTKNEATTLTAQWTVNTKTFVFNANGGTSTMNSQTISYASSGYTALTANTFTRDNYDFNGWNTAADGSGTNYTNEQLIARNQITSNSTINLYAQWKIAYTAPEITDLACTRLEENSAQATIDIIWTKGNNGTSDIDSTQLLIAYKKTTSSTWTYITNTTGTTSSIETWISSNETAYSTIAKNLSEEQYDVQVTVRNSSYTNYARTKTNFISTAFYTIDINSDGTAIGLLQAVTDSNEGIYIDNTIFMKDSISLTATESQDKNAIIRVQQIDNNSTVESSISLLANTNNNHGLYSDTHGGNGSWLIYSDNTNIYIGNKNIAYAFPQYINQSYTSDKSTANTWTYTGISFTVPTNHLWIVRISESYTWGKPKGIGLHTSSSLSSWATAPYMASYIETGVETLSCVLVPNTYHIYTYRDSTIASGNTNNYSIFGLDFQIA